MWSKLENAIQTLDALERELRWLKVDGQRAGVQYVPDLLVVALYRLAEVQLDYVNETGGADRCGGWEEFEKQRERFEGHAPLGKWIAEQPSRSR